MSKNYLPAYPEPHPVAGHRMFSASQVEAHVKKAVCDALKVAAEICSEEGREWDSDAVITEKNYAEHCAQRIRTIIPEKDHGEPS
jgi:hypothetical protein